MPIHGTAVAFGGRGVLLRGKPDSGKSSLALRLIDGEGFGLAGERLRAMLVADDQVDTERQDGRLLLSPPTALAGLIEIRGWGIVKMSYTAPVPLHLMVDLQPAASIERLPDPDMRTAEISGLSMPRLFLDPASPEACARLRAVLTSLVASTGKEA